MRQEGGQKQMKIQLTVNGELHELEVPANKRLVDLLREDLHLMGTKDGCREGECGVCTVLFNGKAVNSCLMLAVEADQCEILTIEGLAQDGVLHPIQQAFIDKGATQCGFCTPGMILATKALLNENLRPSDEEIKYGLAGNLCRCTGYASIHRAVKKVAYGGSEEVQD